MVSCPDSLASRGAGNILMTWIFDSCFRVNASVSIVTTRASAPDELQAHRVRIGTGPLCVAEAEALHFVASPICSSSQTRHVVSTSGDARNRGEGK